MSQGSPDVSAAARRIADVPTRLVAVAAELFAKQGFESTSVQAIVSAAGVTKGAMYHYFSSKDDVLYEIYARVLRTQTEQLNKVAALELPPVQRVHAAMVDVVNSTIANLDDTVIFFRSLHQLSQDKQRQVRTERRHYHERFRAMVEEGQRRGEFRSDVPAELVVDYHFGAVHHLCFWYRKDGPLGSQDIAHHFADMLVASLRPG